MRYQTLDIFPLLHLHPQPLPVQDCRVEALSRGFWHHQALYKRYPKALWTINLYEPEERLLPLFFHHYCEVRLLEEASMLLEACPSDYDMPCTVYAYPHNTCSLCHSIGFSWSSSFWTAIHLIWTVKPDTNQYNVKKKITSGTDFTTRTKFKHNALQYTNRSLALTLECHCSCVLKEYFQYWFLMPVCIHPIHIVRWFWVKSKPSIFKDGFFPVEKSRL